MNRQQFIDIIKDPAAHGQEQGLAVVKELIESFPYYAAPYAVLAKIFYNEQSIYFDKYLKLSAAYVGDRELLYEYLHTATEAAQVEQAATKEVHEAIISPAEQLSPATAIEESIPDETKEELHEIFNTAPVAESKANALVENNQEDQAPALAENTKTNDEQQQEEKPSRKRRTYTGTDPLGLESLAAFDYFAFQGKINRHETQEFEPAGNEEVKVKKLKNQPEQNTLQESYSFTEWMQKLKQPQVKTPPPKADIKIEKSGSASSKQQLDDIISNFIRTEPRIKPQQAKIFNPENMAQQSAEEDLSLATETLAGIYLRQGLEEKAIEIFRQLILKYPEKSTYFADKIAAIKNKEI